MKTGIDYIGTSVVFYCHDNEGNVILAKRNKNSRDEHGKWDIGGGALEFATNVEENLKKEIKEEYCTDVLNFEFLGFRDVHRINHNNERTHWIALDFKVLIDKNKVSNGEPHKFDEVKLFSKNNFPKPIHSQLGFFLEKYKDKL